MSWSLYHSQSENYASQAEVAMKQRDFDRADEFYHLAAEQETFALELLDPSKNRTLGITTVSAASLWFKAREYEQAQIVAHKGLAMNSLPPFAIDQLQKLLQAIWNEEALAKAGVKFVRGEVLVSVSGGEVVTGGAPLDFILRKVDEVGRLFYRTIEMLLDLPHRRRGAPSLEIQEQFRPWLFQAPTGSYQFAVRVEKPKQLSLFSNVAPSVEKITETFLGIVKTSADDPEGDLTKIVPNEDYRKTFLKLTRNLAPTGTQFGKLEIKSSEDIGFRPVVLVPTSREIISDALRKTKTQQEKADEQREIQLRGILRGLQLDNDWIEINLSSESPNTIRIYETGDVIDDVVGPMVNHKVMVSVIKKPNGRYAYRDIQTEE